MQVIFTSQTLHEIYSIIWCILQKVQKVAGAISKSQILTTFIDDVTPNEIKLSTKTASLENIQQITTKRKCRIFVWRTIYKTTWPKNSIVQLVLLTKGYHYYTVYTDQFWDELMIGITVYNIDKHFIATNFHWHWAIYNSTVLHVNFVHRKPMTSVARGFDYSQRKVSTLMHAMKSAAFFFPLTFSLASVSLYQEND